MLFCFLGLAQAATVSWNGNVTINNNNDGRFSYRGSSISSILGSLASSAGVIDVGEGTARYQGTSARFDATTGFPRGWAASLVVEFNAGGGDIFYSGQGSFGGLAYGFLEEVDPANASVAIVKLDRLTWTPGSYQDPRTHNGLAQLEYTGSGNLLYPFNNGELKITAVMSTTYGKLDTGAILTPNSVESVFEVKNWKFKDPANHLRLTLWVGLASRTTTAVVKQTTSGFENWVAGSGAYASFFSTATVAKNGANVAIDVHIDVSVRSLSDLPPSLVESASLGTKATWNVQQVAVNFPPGEGTVVYDPSVGSNDLPQASAVARLAPFATLFLFVFALL